MLNLINNLSNVIISQETDQEMKLLIEIFKSPDAKYDNVIIDSEFPCFQLARKTISENKNELQIGEYQSIVTSEFLKWALNKIENTNIDKIEIRSFLKIISLFKNQNALWECFKRNNAKPSFNFYAFTRNCIENCSINLSHAHLARDLSEKTIEEIKKLEIEKQWDLLHTRIDRTLEQIKYSIDYDTFLCTRFLDIYDRENFLIQIENQKNILLVLCILSSINFLSCLDMSANCVSEKIRFASLSVYISHQESQKEINEIEAIILKDTFIKLSYNSDEFYKWMRILNQHPGRYNKIQRSLGMALASIHRTDILEIYFNQINLFPHAAKSSRDTSSSRESIMICCDEFSKNTDSDFSKKAWTLAYIKWDKWNFGTTNKDGYVFDISVSEIDYPVIKYYMECMSEQEREKEINDILACMSNVENIWHSSQSSLITYWNVCLSRLQMLYHSNKAISSPEKAIDLYIFFTIDIGEMTEYMNSLIEI